MPRRTRANALVEFTLAFPLFTFLFLGFADFCFLAIQQLSLERLCIRTARYLTLGSGRSPEELSTTARLFLARHHAPELFATVRLYSLPTRPSLSPHRFSRHAEVIELRLEQTYRPLFFLVNALHGSVPFVLSARVREARLR